MNLTYETTVDDWGSSKVVVLRLKGHLDRPFDPSLDDELQTLIDKGLNFWAIDLSGLDYLSSSGITSFISLKGKLVRISGKICFFSPSERIEKILTVMGMRRVDDFFNSEEDAKENFPKAKKN